ncbi:WcaI family glycosyltransferase [Pedobacter psychroterrae]|uniref:Colanic acid biosynthesis glycosyltransferase WcaI n=1 Tax=Pedobacter psychroterrae TaxID=2530453 RepID=A0A4R0NNY5_9SPHI|nr:WcaI family glycosyltransferase [Pedobacter psychroterrae]TCD02670.1 colanic acid biosynthesis glycosyltransferase WcaI [Pedobacter psychroterrae]
MEIKKSVLVLGINCFPELTGIGKYSGEMVKWFAENGHRTTMVTTPPYYPNWKVQPPYSGKWYLKEKPADNLTIYRCPLYVPSAPTGLKRLIHEMTFFVSAFFVVFKLLFHKKHDVIMAIAPPFHLGFLALFYRFFKGGKIVYHIQDLQIEAAKELKMLKPWMFGLLFSLERFILNRVNIISTISAGMKKKIHAKVNRSITLFPNWVDTDSYYPVSSRHALKAGWGFLPEDRLVLYSGSIGEKQGLDSILRIAKELSSHERLKFIICGTGPFKEKLQQMAAQMELRNLSFLPLQPNEVFNDFMNIADVHLVLQKSDASDLVMPSKLTTILSVGGLALVTAKDGTTLYEVIKTYKMGEVIFPEDDLLLSRAILNCSTGDFSEERINARQYAERYLNKDNILRELTRSF